MRKFISILVATALLFASCSNKDLLSDQFVNLPENQMAVLAVFNAVSNTDQVDVLLNGERLNTNLEMLRYGEFMRHRIVYPGNRTLSMNIRFGSRTLSTAAESLNLSAGRNYSLLLTNGNPVQTALVEDDLLLPRNGQFKVRFLNTNTDGLAVSIGNNPTASNVFPPLAAGKMSAFATLDIDEYSLLFAGQNSAAVNHAFDLNPANQGVYTIWLTGSLLNKDKADQPTLYAVIKHP